LQRVSTIYQKPLSSIPEGTRLLAEVSVPFTTPYRYSRIYGWQPMSPPMYYSSVHWIEAVEEGPAMADYNGPWYRIFDELDSNVSYHVPAVHMRVLPPEYLEPISPDIPYEQKLIELNLTTQRLYAYEYGNLVFETNVSTGIPGKPLDGGLKTTTPDGKFTIMDKVPAKHMGASYFGSATTGNFLADVDNYILPGVPWSLFFTVEGHAFHGTYWHENYGTPMSKGCINMRNDEVNWLFRWARPISPPDAVATRGLGTAIEIHY
jgi:lipoprotein-anchoring transpeptidase ErfK/SrfK